MGATTLLGGSPLRMMRLTAAGAGFVREGRAPRSDGERQLARRLADAGLVHRTGGVGPFTVADVTVVVPVHDDPRGLAATLAAVPDARVVDDVDGRGPAWARNQGWRATTTPVVAFLDAGCVPEPGWLESLLPHFGDGDVAAVAPRVTSAAGPGVLARYETARSPLDRGPRAGPVRPGSWVPYVPTAALVVRRAALEAMGGFDEALRYGEDVDLVWRLADAGQRVRYEPTTTVTHPPRPDLARWLRQRYHYGTSAAPLAIRHRRAVAPLAVSRWTAAAWALAAAGSPAAGIAVAATSSAPLLRQLPAGEVARVAGGGHLRAGARLAEGARRTWWPLTLAAALVSRRARRLAPLAAFPLVADWVTDRRPLPLHRYVALRIADDLAYGAGVWSGVVRHRSARALAPVLT